MMERIRTKSDFPRVQVVSQMGGDGMERVVMG